MANDEDHIPVNTMTRTGQHVTKGGADNNQFSRDDLVAGLHARGVCYLSPTPHGDEKTLSDDELIAGIARAEDARLRFALAGLFLVRPDLTRRAVALEPFLEDGARDELRKQYVAAMYLQRLWRTHLRLLFGETSLIPEHFTTEMDLPAPDVMHGELGLRMLCDRSSYNDWSSYQQVIDLIGNQPCMPPDIFDISNNGGEGTQH